MEVDAHLGRGVTRPLPRSPPPASVGGPRWGCSLPCLPGPPRGGGNPPLSSCVPRRLQPRGTGPQRRHPDQRQTGSTAPDCHRPMRTIWVYKGTPNPPVKPSGVLNRGIVFNPSWVADPRAKRLSRESPILAEAGRGELEVTRVSVSRDCRRVGCGGMGAFDFFGHFVLPPRGGRGEPRSPFDQSRHPPHRHHPPPHALRVARRAADAK